MTNESPAICIDNVDFSWRSRTGSVQAVQHLTAEFPAGVPHVICGPSGSGKSTLAYLIAGLADPERGCVTLNGTDVREQRQRIACLFQFPEKLFYEETVRDEFAALNGHTPSAKQNGILGTLGLDMDALGSLHPFQLSEGYGRLVALAFQAARNPAVFILDEPTVGLDWRFHSRVERFLGGWSTSQRILIIITHDIDFIRRIGGRSWILSEGALIWNGPTEELLADKELQYRSSLMA